jgi:hypothetical protein
MPGRHPRPCAGCRSSHPLHADGGTSAGITPGRPRLRPFNPDPLSTEQPFGAVLKASLQIKADTHIGGSRAGTATGDPHGTRLVLQRVSEPSAEYSCPPRQSADCDDGIYIVQFWTACRNARPCVATRRIRRCIRWQRFAPGAGSPAAGPSARSATGSVALFLSGRLPG